MGDFVWAVLMLAMVISWFGDEIVEFVAGIARAIRGEKKDEE